MHPKKDKAVENIKSIVELICNETLCPKELKTQDSVEWVLNLKKDEINTIIAKIVNAMPDKYFMHNTPLLENDLNQVTAKEFILFHSQEDIKDEKYPGFLENFIYDLINQLNDEVFRGKGY